MTLTSTFVSFIHLPKKAVWRWTLLAVLPLVILLGVNRWSAKGAWSLFPSKPPQVNFNMALQMAYFSQDNDWDSTIVLNNNAKDERFVQVTLYGKDGQPLNVPIFSIPANSIRRFKLSDWTLGANNFREGNINVATHGKPMEITGQVSIVNRQDRLEFESKPSMTAEYSSQRLNGIVALPDRQAKAYIALTNTSASPIEVSLTSDSEHVHADKVKLSAHETKVEEIKLKNGNNSPLSALVTLQHNGSVGALITTAYAVNKQTGFSANLYFYDDAKTVSNKLAGAHFRFGEANPAEGFPAGTVFKAPLVLANLGNAASTATVTVDYTQNGQAKTQSIGSFTLQPRGVKEIELQSALATFGVAGFVDNAGVDIKYTGTAGTVVGQLTSMSTDGDYSFDVPVKDPLAGMNRNTGSYPFRLDGVYNTVLHLKNTTDKAVYAAVQIRYEGGTYNPNQIKLEPFQTVAVDIKRFQSTQALDIRKGVLPANVTSGKVIWYERTGGSLIGRAETADFSAGIAGSFSCGGTCYCGMKTTSAYMDPYFYYSVVGDHGNPFAPMETLSDCNGDYYYGPYVITSGLSFNSSNSSVATVTSSGYVECMSTGSCNINFTYNALVAYDGDYSCNPYYNNFYDSGSIQIVDFSVTASKGNDNCPVYVKPSGIVSGLTGADPAIPAADTQLTLTVTTNPPTAGRSVTVAVEYIGDSNLGGNAGHVSHTGVRPKGTLGAASGTTDVNGKFTTTYTSPILSGLFRFKATMNQVTKDSCSFIVGIDSLQVLGSGTNYDLTGATATHPDNHFGTAIAVTNLPLIANDYMALYPGSAKLSYNDMGLPFGGKFEIAGDWGNGSHAEHRVGRNIDLGSSNVPQSRWAAINQIFTNRNVQSVNDETACCNHWHLRFQTQ